MQSMPRLVSWIVVPSFLLLALWTIVHSINGDIQLEIRVLIVSIESVDKGEFRDMIGFIAATMFIARSDLVEIAMHLMPRVVSWTMVRSVL